MAESKTLASSPSSNSRQINKGKMANLFFELPQRRAEPPRDLHPCYALPAQPNNVIYTGAVEHGNFRECRRASWAFVHSVGGYTTMHQEHLLPMGEFPDQTINQAEAYAILQALRHTTGAVHIITDSKHCYDLFTQMHSADLTLVANGHLWYSIQQAASNRACTIEKIRSHQKQPQEHEPQWEHWKGNEAADYWAGQALHRFQAIVDSDKHIKQQLQLQMKIAQTAGHIAGHMARQQQWDYTLPKWKRSAENPGATQSTATRSSKRERRQWRNHPPGSRTLSTRHSRTTLNCTSTSTPASRWCHDPQ
eukprot:1580333-Amphidinium_carterae.1